MLFFDVIGGLFNVIMVDSDIFIFDMVLLFVIGVVVVWGVELIWLMEDLCVVVICFVFDDVMFDFVY